MRSKQIKAEEDEEKEQMRNVENEIKAAEKQTKALAARQTKRPARKRPPEPAQVHPQEQLEDDEAALQAEEDEARAKMEAAVRARKRFVKNQKAILAALQAKKDEKARRREEQEQEQE